MALLEIRDIDKNFGGLRALNGVSFKVDEEEIVGLIGPNGAGKTTLFNIISGFLKPTNGSVFFNGEGITGLKPHLVAAKGIIRTFQATVLFHDLSVMQNILVGFHIKAGSGVWKDLSSGLRHRKEDKSVINKAVDIIEFFGLGQFKEELARNLPHGHQRLVGMAVALAANPRLLLLDEPVTGMNPVETMEAMDHIKRIAKERAISIVIVEHDMKAVMSVCERIIVLSFGSKIAEGSPDEIMTNRQVIEAYLGSEYGRLE
jgi:branched-chain amino acid transport system ATP-binding protein